MNGTNAKSNGKNGGPGGRGGLKLGRLLQACPGASLEGPAAVEITGLAYDSRQVRPGTLFFALSGAKTDGGLFLDDAARRGAALTSWAGWNRPYPG